MIISKIHLELRLPRSSGVGNNIPDVVHTGGQHDETLEAEAESSMRHSSVFPQIHVPPVVRFVEAVVFQFAFEDFVSEISFVLNEL
jgi:hypothetical protein